MDVDKAFEVDNGLLITDGPFYTGGTASPVGLDLPELTFYLQTTTAGVLVWRKFGPGVNDWRQLSAQDIPFDPSGLLNYNVLDIDVDLALRRLGILTSDVLTLAEYFESLGQENTTSNSWVNKSGFPLYTDVVKPIGRYKMSFTAEIGQSNAGDRVGFRARHRPEGGTWFDVMDTRDGVASDGQYKLVSGSSEFDLLVAARIQLRIQWGQTDDGGTGRIRNVKVKIERIAD